MHTIRISRPQPFNQIVRVPGDKSITHRAIMFGAIAHGKTRVDNYLAGADCLSTISCFKRMGVAIEQVSETSLQIEGKGFSGLQEPYQILDVGNSGTTLRLLLGILAGAPFFSTLIGDESIARRPMGRVVVPLRQMGAEIYGRAEGRFTPLAVRGGRLQGIDYANPIASAQVKSALLLAGLQAEGTTTVREPYVSRDHTERMLLAFGVELNRVGAAVSLAGEQSLSATHVQVPGDISSAAFLLGAALMVPHSRITVEQVGLNPTRTGIVDVFRQMGAEVEMEETNLWCNEPVGRITMSRGELRGVEVGGELIPRLIDEIPILAVVATQAHGETVIRDAAELKVKETNRIQTTVQELRKLGAQIEETEDGMRIWGPTPLKGGICHSHGDHRIGMAMAIAGLGTEESVVVEGTEAIDVSFPGFGSLLQQLGNREPF